MWLSIYMPGSGPAIDDCISTRTQRADGEQKTEGEKDRSQNSEVSGRKKKSRPQEKVK